eukprot:scaffold407362_cov39-Prasinocladus_malaysianus.AAC.1
MQDNIGDNKGSDANACSLLALLSRSTSKLAGITTCYHYCEVVLALPTIVSLTAQHGIEM